MARPVGILAVLCCAVAPASATWYTVTNTDDSGTGSLRWAIEQANTHVGTDLIWFDLSLRGSTIAPLTPLPTVTGEATIINGNPDGDDDPDIAIDGTNLASGDGLRVEADDCEVQGFAIVRCPSAGLRFYRARSPLVFNCHLGVNLAGETKQGNLGSDLVIRECQQAAVGSYMGRLLQNVIAGGVAGTSSQGIRIIDSTDVDVLANYIGLKRSGAAAFGDGNIGISVESIGSQCLRVAIGDDARDDGNLFAGLREGIRIYGGEDHEVVWNWFGLAADGDTVLPLTGPCIRLFGGVHDSDIGESFFGVGPNVFAGHASSGVYIEGASTTGNRIGGNYFGSNASGTGSRLLTWGVSVAAGAGANQIGGSRTQDRNHFTSKVGIAFAGGTGSVVRGNRFGVLPDGTGCGAQVWGVTVGEGVDVTLERNIIARSSVAGVLVDGAGANARVYRNIFRNCAVGVRTANDARCHLGNLTDASTANDGGNRFRLTNAWHIRNETDNVVRAEGNDFGTTARAAINAKIWDRRDDAALGRVDFSPLIGGVLPTDVALEEALALTGLTAVPTRTGAQLTFALSCPAEVSARVLNPAGRPIRVLCQARPCEAGTHTLLWDARTETGLLAPGGLYLLEVSARTPAGAQTCALTPTRLTR